MLRELRKGVEVINITGSLTSLTIGRNEKTGQVNGKCGDEVMNNKIRNGTMKIGTLVAYGGSKGTFTSENK
jgi:hypothetical protein